MFRSLYGRDKVPNPKWKSSICIDCENKKKREHYKANAPAYILRTTEWRKANPDTRYAHHLSQKFGMKIETYEEMVKAQNSACAICKKPERRGNKRLSIDHCHSTGKVRGLLCSNCNTSLGLVAEDITTLTEMINYLNNSRGIVSDV